MDPATVERIRDGISYGMLISGFLAFLALLFIPAPYGKHGENASKAWGCKIPGRLAWILQEIPSLAVPIGIFFLNSMQVTILPWKNCLLVGGFLLHYFNRSVVYPLRINNPSATPFIVFAMAFSFCTVNGYLQSVWFYDPSAIDTNDIQYMVGLSLFVIGWCINYHSDSVLRNLRTPRNPEYSPKKRYYIPRGGMFEYVSGANFFGEILEWFGFALAANNLPAWSFAIFTFCNIAPRAQQHHQWYQNKFRDEYPASRCAVIPFIW